jgi:pyruvate ferredoxin oxidoreductase gamma subunit
LKEIRFHGRGGQGVVLAAQLMVVAAFEDGKYGQAFPAFGGERRGAPLQAFIRLDVRPVRVRYHVNQPDYVIILDHTLPNMVDVLSGIKLNGLALIDSENNPSNLRWSADVPVYVVPATRIALDVFHQPFVNPVMLGAWAAVTGEITLQAIQHAYQNHFPGSLGEANSRAVQMGYEFIRLGVKPTYVRKSMQVKSNVIERETEGYAGVPNGPLHFASVVAARTSLDYPTGSWRYNRPLVDPEICNGCGVCEMFCPDSCLMIVDKQAIVDYCFCKGCGICAQTCARGAVEMVVEEA